MFLCGCGRQRLRSISVKGGLSLSKSHSLDEAKARESQMRINVTTMDWSLIFSFEKKKQTALRQGSDLVGPVILVMGFSHVFVTIGAVSECFITEFAVVGFRPRVDVHVRLVLRPVYETLGANRTHKRFLGVWSMNLKLVVVHFL